MKIAICDDEHIILEELKRVTDDYFAEKSMPCKVDTFDNFDDFYCINSEYDLVLLDYSIPGENGIDFAKRLRKENERIFIVFQTSFPDRVFESFSVNTFRYLVKPVKNSVLFEALDDFIRLYQTKRKIAVPTVEKTYYIDTEDVVYIEADRKYSHVRTLTETIKTNKGITLYEEEIFNTCFFRTHRSYIVNMKYVSAIEKKTVSLTNGEKVIVSPKRYDEFIKCFNDYLKYKI